MSPEDPFTHAELCDIVADEAINPDYCPPRLEDVTMSDITEDMAALRRAWFG